MSAIDFSGKLSAFQKLSTENMTAAIVAIGVDTVKNALPDIIQQTPSGDNPPSFSKNVKRHSRHNNEMSSNTWKPEVETEKQLSETSSLLRITDASSATSCISPDHAQKIKAISTSISLRAEATEKITRATALKEQSTELKKLAKKLDREAKILLRDADQKIKDADALENVAKKILCSPRINTPRDRSKRILWMGELIDIQKKIEEATLSQDLIFYRKKEFKLLRDLKKDLDLELEESGKAKKNSYDDQIEAQAVAFIALIGKEAFEKWKKRHP